MTWSGPGLLPLDVLGAELLSQTQADLLVKFLWADLRAFFLAGVAGRFVGPCLSAGANENWNVFVKGGFQWLAPTGFSSEQGERQVPSQPRDCSRGAIRSRQVPLKPWLLEHEALRGAPRYSWVRIKSCRAM